MVKSPSSIVACFPANAVDNPAVSVIAKSFAFIVACFP